MPLASVIALVGENVALLALVLKVMVCPGIALLKASRKMRVAVMLLVLLATAGELEVNTVVVRLGSPGVKVMLAF